MRRLIYSLFFIIYPFSCFAQQPWNFSSIEEACRSNAYLVEPSAEQKGRIRDDVVYNSFYHISGPYTRLFKDYVRFQNDSLDFSLAIDEAKELLPYLISDGYIRQRFAKLLEWQYVEMGKANGILNVDTTDHRFLRYSQLHFLGYKYQPSQLWPLSFLVVTNTNEVQNLSLPNLRYLAENSSFATQSDRFAFEKQEAEKQEAEILHRQKLQCEIDSLANLSNIASRQADSIATKLQQDSVDEAQAMMQAEIKRTKHRMNRDQIFIMSIKPARSDYMFGIELNLYNCFSKTISKIELKVAPYNDRGQVQPDKFERKIRNIRCMGPIRPGSPAQFVFDELFWNDNGRIKYMRVTSITFHFIDGTQKTFNGYNKILKHSLE